MTISEIKKQARQNLSGKWGKAALITFVVGVVTYAISFSLSFTGTLGSLLGTLMSLPLSFGLISSMFKINDNDEVTVFGFLNYGFSAFGKVWSTTLHMFLKLIIPIIFVLICIFIIAYAGVTQNDSLQALGIILYIISILYMTYKQFSYKLGLLVLYDNPEMTGKEAIKKSAELMKGKIWSLILLNLSFIGWIILCIPTIGLGMLWLSPYIQISEINFYRSLTGEVTPEVVNTVNE